MTEQEPEQIEEIFALDEDDENADLMVGEEVEDPYGIDTSKFKEVSETEESEETDV